nr:MAG TPA: hypothetical protein [Caudoviricetes sp.]
MLLPAAVPDQGNGGDIPTAVPLSLRWLPPRAAPSSARAAVPAIPHSWRSVLSSSYRLSNPKRE